MYSNLTKTDYEIKDMNLQELRDRIISENNLTPLDILKGFHEKSEFNLEYESALTEQNRKDIEIIHKEYERFVKEYCENIQSIYDEKFNSVLSNYPDITLEDVLAYEKNGRGYTRSVSVSNDCSRFVREVSKLDDVIRKEVKAYALDKTRSFIKDTFGDSYAVRNDDGINNEYGYLPYKVDVNASSKVDFSEIYEHLGHDGYSFDEWLRFTYNSPLKEETATLKFHEFNRPSVYVHLSEEKAKEIFDNAINSVIYNNNSIGELEFFQNLEAQPITVNVNTKSGKCELIDGYKRLLYITDEKLLSNTAPIKVFTDLTDTEFLTLLYAANMWKTNDTFHDRGFLFAMKTRFGFEIPTRVYDNLELCSNELDIIQLYDFGGNLVRVDKSKLMNTLTRHKHLANDMKVLYNFEYKGKYKYDDNMLNEIMFTIIEGTGEFRRKEDSDTQNELTEELVASIFEDDLVKELCSKKHLSTRTYVMNYFRDKDIYKHIGGLLRKNLVGEN